VRVCHGRNGFSSTGDYEAMTHPDPFTDNTAMDKIMDAFEEKDSKWKRIMIERGHEPRLDRDGSIDYFAYENGYHNGPLCEKCWWSTCWHCNGPEDSIPETCWGATNTDDPS
jgi:predicted metal-binding protein